jgi:hypothetical protein
VVGEEMRAWLQSEEAARLRPISPSEPSTPSERKS